MDRVKLLAWDGSGMVLVTKWLHQGHFTWPPIGGGVVHLSATQLAMLLDGLEWTRASPQPVKQPALAGREVRSMLEHRVRAWIVCLWRLALNPSRRPAQL